jgi:phosphoserine aminotransferase
MLYSVIDESHIDGYDTFYSCKVSPQFRSRINVVFRVGINNDHREMESKFIEEAAALKIINIKGHHSNPGIRISMYNAMPM